MSSLHDELCSLNKCIPNTFDEDSNLESCKQ